jgi:hypothetical protein
MLQAARCHCVSASSQKDRKYCIMVRAGALPAPCRMYGNGAEVGVDETRRSPLRVLRKCTQCALVVLLGSCGIAIERFAEQLLVHHLGFACDDPVDIDRVGALWQSNPCQASIVG